MSGVFLSLLTFNPHITLSGKLFPNGYSWICLSEYLDIVSSVLEPKVEQAQGLTLRGGGYLNLFSRLTGPFRTGTLMHGFERPQRMATNARYVWSIF